jgi:hypothetical protein
MTPPPDEIVALRERLAWLDDLADGDREARHAAIVAVAEALRFHDPEVAAALLCDVTGEPEAIVADLAADKPYLVRPTMDDLIRAAVRGRSGQGS